MLANYDPVVDPSLESDGTHPPTRAVDLAPCTDVATPPVRAFPSMDGTASSAGGDDASVPFGDSPLTAAVDGNEDKGTSVDAPPLYTISPQDEVPPSTQPEESDSDSDNRPRASARNPIYGKIDGCYKGNDEYGARISFTYYQYFGRANTRPCSYHSFPSHDSPQANYDGPQGING